MVDNTLCIGAYVWIKFYVYILKSLSHHSLCTLYHWEISIYYKLRSEIVILRIFILQKHQAIFNVLSTIISTIRDNDTRQFDFISFLDL